MDVPQELVETVVNSEAYADWPRIDQAYRWLRREAPLALIQPSGYPPFRPAVRHADILEIEQKTQLFSADVATLTPIEGLKKTLEMTGKEYPLPTFLAMD